MIHQRPTGLERDSDRTRADLCATARYRARGTLEVHTVLQPWQGATDQGAKPSCVGHAVRGRVRALTGYDLSAVDLWTDARRLDGRLSNPLAGTTASSAIQSLTRRGASPYRDGEDARSTDLDVAQCDLRSDMVADAHRLPLGFRHSTIDGPVSQMLVEVIDALEAGLAVVVGAGRREAYFSAPANVVLDGSYFGGSLNGHEEGIVGYHHPQDAFLVAGSWGSNFGGVFVAGNAYPGCVLVATTTLLEEAWSIDAFEAVKLCGED